MLLLLLLLLLLVVIETATLAPLLFEGTSTCMHAVVIVTLLLL